MNLGQLKEFLESISTSKYSADFNRAIFAEFTKKDSKLTIEYLGCGMYREAWLIGGTIVVKFEYFAATYMETCHPFANRWEREFYINAPKNIQKFLCPCMWVSTNGMVAIYRYEKVDDEKFLPHEHRAFKIRLEDKNPEIQQLINIFTREIFGPGNSKTLNRNKVVIIDYALNRFGDEASRFRYPLYTRLVEVLSQEIEATLAEIVAKVDWCYTVRNRSNNQERV